MNKKHGLGTFGAILLSLGLTIPVSALADCVQIRGKIFNNAQGPGSTLGIAHIIFGNEKFKCGLRGNGKMPDDPGDGELNFDHTIVCDDDVGLEDPVHSQLTFDTSGDITAVLDYCAIPGLQSFSFLEVSEPVIGTGTGQFAGVTSGSLTIEGTLFCSLAIDMEFSGELCF